MKKNKIYIALVMVGLSIMGCKKSFLDINNNPNSATESSITPDLAMAAQLAGSAARNANSYDFLNRWMGYWSASGSYSPSTVEWSYNITNDSYSGIWNNTYYAVKQYKSIENKAAELDWKFYQGMAQIMQAYEVSALVDIYGNVPYSEAWNLGEHLRPAYDNAEDIYKDVMAKINSGLALIKAAGSDKNINTIDIMFHGDKTMWAKFANTLKLRLLIHTSEVTTFNASTEVAAIVSEGSGFLGSGASAMIQPGYTSPDKPNPYYSSHLHTSSGNEADNYNRANNFSLNLMKNLNDLRYTRLYRECKSLAGQFRGTDYGALPADDVNSDRTSGPGYGLVGVNESKFATPPSGPTAAALTAAVKPMWVITSVESLFLVAEATARGWLSGNAQTAYNAAVTESFVTLAVPNATTEAATYLSNPNVRVAWPTSTALADKLNVILWQKYFALNGLQANETWVDFRRLGIVQPPLSIFPQRGTNPIPIRLLYPSSEYNYNNENVKAQGDISQFTSKIFWDK